MKKIIIEITDNTASDIADILCWMSGYLASAEDHQWLQGSLESLREVNRQIKIESLED